MSKKHELFGTKSDGVTMDEFPIADTRPDLTRFNSKCIQSPRSGFWKCRQCHQPQQGGVSYQVGLKAVCETCAKALQDATQTTQEENDQQA